MLGLLVILEREAHCCTGGIWQVLQYHLVELCNSHRTRMGLSGLFNAHPDRGHPAVPLLYCTIGFSLIIKGIVLQDTASAIVNSDRRVIADRGR